MLVDVFRSGRKSDTYLFLPRGADFQALPELLRKSFGSPELALSLQLTPERQLAHHDTQEVIRALETEGFFLQLPPRSSGWQAEAVEC